MKIDFYNITEISRVTDVAEMQTYKQQAHGVKDNRLWDEAGGILKNRQEERKNIQERLRKLENDIKEEELC
jgi:predicted 2-oxoglutarate/Fe(II)-dependent dioxygenase YbiX